MLFNVICLAVGGIGLGSLLGDIAYHTWRRRRFQRIVRGDWQRFLDQRTGRTGTYVRSYLLDGPLDDSEEV